MEKDNKHTKTAIIALIISSLAMVGTLGNFIFTYWKYKEGEKIDINLKHALRAEASIEIENINESLGYPSNPIRIRGQSPFTSINHPSDFFKSIILTLELRITNQSKRKATIESIWSSIRFNDRADGFLEVLNYFPIKNIMRKNGNPIAMPLVLTQREQISILIKARWPLEKKMIQKIREVCPKVWNNSTKLGDLHHCLEQNSLSLTQSFRWADKRQLRILLKTPEGEYIESDLSNLDKFTFY